MIRNSILILAVVFCGIVHGQVADNTPIIEASGLSITKAEFEAMLKGDSKYSAAFAQPAGKKALGVEFGKAFALEAEARRRKLDQSQSFQLRIRNYAQQVLANELLVTLRQQYMDDAAALKAHYDSRRTFFDQPRVRQILVRFKGSEVAARPGLRELSKDEARAKANDLHAKLVAGADFAALAKNESDEIASRLAGGEMGFILRGSTGANFEAAAFSVPAGKLSDVVQTEFGFHILRVEERRPMPLESVKAVVANELAHRDMDAIIRNGYKLNDAYFGK